MNLASFLLSSFFLFYAAAVPTASAEDVAAVTVAGPTLAARGISTASATTQNVHGAIVGRSPLKALFKRVKFVKGLHPWPTYPDLDWDTHSEENRYHLVPEEGMPHNKVWWHKRICSVIQAFDCHTGIVRMVKAPSAPRDHVHAEVSVHPRVRGSRTLRIWRYDSFRVPPTLRSDTVGWWQQLQWRDFRYRNALRDAESPTLNPLKRLNMTNYGYAMPPPPPPEN